jgi:hypothetical protein
MGVLIDNLLAYRILSMMVKPFTDTEAFKLGIIDAHGKNIRTASSLKTQQEKAAYTYLDRLVFNMKKIVNKIGGENQLKSLAAALWLVREQYKSGDRSTALMQEKFDNIMKMMDNRVSLVEEEIVVKKFLEEDGEGGAVANVTGAAVSTDQPKIYPKDVKKYKAGQAGVIAGMARRPKLVGVK